MSKRSIAFSELGCHGADHDPGATPFWYELDCVKQFPLIYRSYLWWLKHGIKRKGGFSFGGNRLFSLLCRFYEHFPYRCDNLITIPIGASFRMTLDLLDFEIGHHTLALSMRVNGEAKLLKMLIPTRGVFFDVGANHGYYSLLASHICGPGSLICAFEPQPRLAQALKKSKEVNGLKQLRVLQVALGNELHRVPFYVPYTGSGIGSLFRDHAGAIGPVKMIEVQMTTLDLVLEAMQFSRLDVVKVDVEGAELNVLKGGRRTIAKFQPFIVFELNPKAQHSAGHNQEEIFAFLEGNGYRVFYDFEALARGIRREKRAVKEITNILAVPESKMGVLSDALRGANRSSTSN